MKQTFSFEIENVSKGDVKLNGTKVVLTNEMSADEINSVGGVYGKLVEAIVSIGAMVKRLENGEPIQQLKNEDETPSEGASKSTTCAAYKKAKTLNKSEKKRGRKAAKKLEELLKEDNEDAQAKAGWDTL